ncbi:MAG TPA: autotransporter domain-containing protein [Xanthobacteraceae bacterium]|nr:autotransporter domain-containing protein [Xanthobacteraceae bacterium]
MRFRLVLFRRRRLLTSAALLLSVQVSNAQQINQFIGFGDSSIDSGYFLTHQISANPTNQSAYNASAAIGGGLPTTPGGPMNSQVLASYFGLSAIPVGMPGGTNYAASGATNESNGSGFSLANPFAPATPTQMQSYLNANGGLANPNALYLISSGGNDVGKVICPNGNCGVLSAAEQQAALAANLLINGVAQLRSAGAQYIVVAINLGTKTPAQQTPGTPSADVKQTYNHALYNGLTAAGINFIPADGKAVADAVGFNPAMFGLTNITAGSTVTRQGGACINPSPATIPNSWALECTTLVAPNAQQTYLFADDEHYSAAGQKIEADYIYSLIVAPSEMSYLAEVPVKTRDVVISSIDNQIPVSLAQPGFYHAWVSGDVSWLKMSSDSSFPDDPGTPVSATAGFDFRLTPNWLVGVAFSGGSTRQSFSLGGDFTLDEFAISAYAAYVSGPFWGNAIASGGGLFFDTNRQVPIGITVQPNTGSTKGSDFSLMLETGYDFASPIGRANAVMPVMPVMPVKAAKAAPAAITVTHGPVVGITLQQVRVNGFTETDQFAADDAGGFTALSFASQTRNSAVTELGYQAHVDLGVWRPFGKIVWNHELADTSRTVTAFLTTTSFAPGYSLPAVVFGEDWGTATLGTSLKMSRDVTGLATFVSQFAEHNVTTYGGQLGINIAFEPEIASTTPVKASRVR